MKSKLLVNLLTIATSVAISATLAIFPLPKANAAVVTGGLVTKYSSDIAGEIIEQIPTPSGKKGFWYRVTKFLKEQKRYITTIVQVIDPPGGTIYNGSLTLRYNTSLFEVSQFGWFGAFAEDSTLPVPPVGIDGFLQEDSTLVLQSPSSKIIQNVNVDPVEGLISINFDAGSDGLPIETSDHFNFFGVVYSLKQPGEYIVDSVEQGKGDIGILLGSESLICTVGFSDIKQTCGSETQSTDLKLISVPEPSFLIGTVSLGVLGLASTLKRNRKLSKSTKKIEKVS